LAFPDLGDHTERIRESLEDRFAQVPFHRVRSEPDHWALWSVENDHVKGLARREDLTTSQTRDLAAYWHRRVEATLHPTMERLRFRGMDNIHRSRVARHLGHGVAFQIWMNTIGPGGRTWFANRYSRIRHYTFRLHWRP
jgi:hypothetical protein